METTQQQPTITNTGLSMDLLDANWDNDSLFDTQNTGDDITPDEDVITPDNLFTEEQPSPEKVGNEDNQPAVAPPEPGSPSTISSILTALKDDGVLPDIDDNKIKLAKTATDFAAIIQDQVNARFTAEELRIKNALDAGLAPPIVQQYEGAISYLNTLQPDTLSVESDEAMALRKDLIYQDFINRGFSPDRAKREVEKSVTAGTDVEDAISALESNKDFFTNKYNSLLAAQQAEHQAKLAAEKKQKEDFAKLINTTVEPFQGITLDAMTRKKILDNATKPVEKDADGNLYTAMQKALREDPIKFSYYQSLFFTLTDGYTNINKLIGGPVTSATRKAASNIEKVLNSQSNFNDSGGDLFKREDNSKAFDFKIDI